VATAPNRITTVIYSNRKLRYAIENAESLVVKPFCGSCKNMLANLKFWMWKRSETATTCVVTVMSYGCSKTHVSL
jgi:hypothetical protein